jgi:hypothetical protein
MRLPNQSPGIMRSVGTIKGRNSNSIFPNTLYTPTMSRSGLSFTDRPRPPLRAYCCGSVNTTDKTGKGCVDLPTFSTCAGNILACAGGSVLLDSGEAGCL